MPYTLSRVFSLKLIIFFKGTQNNFDAFSAGGCLSFRKRVEETEKLCYDKGENHETHVSVQKAQVIPVHTEEKVQQQDVFEKLPAPAALRRMILPAVASRLIGLICNPAQCRLWHVRHCLAARGSMMRL